MYPTRVLIAVAAVLASPATGCSDMGCTEEARSSVSAKVQDSKGSTVTNVEVMYSVNGESPKRCEKWNPNVEYFVWGWEQDGIFVITATRGSESDTATMLVTSGNCHVNSETVTITLSP